MTNTQTSILSSGRLQNKVAELEKELEIAEAEKANTANRVIGWKKTSAEFRELQTELGTQTEKNRFLQVVHNDAYDHC